MQHLSGREKWFLSSLVILAILVLVGARLPTPDLPGPLGEVLRLVIDALHRGGDLAGFVGGIATLVTLAISALGRPAPALATTPVAPALTTDRSPPPEAPYATSRFAFRHQVELDFLGRAAELDWLDRAWAGGLHCLSIIAWGGVGKTALLAHWLHTRFFASDFQGTENRPAPARAGVWPVWSRPSAPFL